MNKKNQDLIYMEECFKNIKSKNNVEENLQAIKRIISRQFDIEVGIGIVQNDSRPFFGMSIYPNQDVISMMVEDVLLDRSRVESLMKVWGENRQWILEIDSNLIYDTNLNANPAEIVAVLLHEIGHTVYSNTIPQRVYKVLKYEFVKQSLTMRKLLKWKKVQRLFDLVFIEACSSKSYSYINLDSEREADKFVVTMGYGDNLNNFIGKLLTTHGNSLINRTEDSMERDVKMMTQWTLENVAELEYRKTKLRSSLERELLSNPSNFVRIVINDIKNYFFGKSKDKYKEIVNESMLVTQHQKIVKESLFDLFDKYGRLKKIKQSDIDILTIEKGRIRNEDDKIYVLDLIYDNLEIINNGIRLLDENKKDKVPVTKETLLNYKAQLEKIRKDVLEAPIQPPTYGLFIRYPKGYEG